MKAIQTDLFETRDLVALRRTWTTAAVGRPIVWSYGGGVPLDQAGLGAGSGEDAPCTSGMCWT